MSSDQQATGNGAKQAKPSAVEGFKSSSGYLQGPIGDELSDHNPYFGKASIQLLKHHGVYQQDNRDERGRDGKAYSFMVGRPCPAVG